MSIFYYILFSLPCVSVQFVQVSTRILIGHIIVLALLCVVVFRNSSDYFHYSRFAFRGV